MEELTYFVSHAREDSEVVLKLTKELRAVGAKLWLDQLDIVAGQRWDRAVEEALATCQGMIVLLSPASVESHNVMDEVSYALEEGKLVIPILLRSCAIPFRLRRVQYINFASSYETGFSQLLRALRIDQPLPPLESAAPQEPPVRNVSTPSKESSEESPTAAALPLKGSAKTTADYFKEGGTHMEQGDYEQAISDLSEAIRLGPKCAWAYYGSRGKAYRLKGEYDKAIADLSEAIRLGPKYAWAYGSRGQAYRLKGEYDKAIADFSEALQLDPNLTWVCRERDEAYRQKGDSTKQ